MGPRCQSPQDDMKRIIRSDYGRMAEGRIMFEWRESDMAGGLAGEKFSPFGCAKDQCQ